VRKARLACCGALVVLTGCSSGVLDDDGFAKYDQDGVAYESAYGAEAATCRADVESALIFNFRDQRTDPTSTLREHYGDDSAAIDAYREILADNEAQELRQAQGLEAFLDGVNPYILQRCAEI
jgi:hypothetical protein